MMRRRPSVPAARPPVSVDRAHFLHRVLQDAYSDALAAQWRHRALVFEWAAPRRGGYYGGAVDWETGRPVDTVPDVDWSNGWPTRRTSTRAGFGGSRPLRADEMPICVAAPPLAARQITAQYADLTATAAACRAHATFIDTNPAGSREEFTQALADTARGAA